MHNVIFRILMSLSGAGAGVSATNPIVVALIGTSDKPGIIIIAHAVFLGAVLLRSLQEVYEWIITGHAEYGRNAVNLMAGAAVLEKAPEVISVATGIFIPKIF